MAKKEGGKCKKCCRGFGWCLLLFIGAWWISYFAGVFHCCIAPYAACCDCARKGTNILLKVIRLPYFVATFMVKGLSTKKAAIAYLSEV